MRADWTASGACTSGSTAPPRGATRRASGGAATTSTTSVEPSRGCRWWNQETGDLTTRGFRASFPASLLRRLGAALRCQRDGDDRLVRVHVGDGRDADARRLDDVDGVDADARTDVARRRGVVRWHVGRDDGGNDAAVPGPDAVALPPGRWQDRRNAPGSATMLVGVGYFFVWTVFGMAAFPLGVALAAVVMQQPELGRAVPIAVGVIVLIAGALQFTAWKAHHLACCREAPGRGRTLPADAGTAWRHGLRLGLHCSYCCAGLTAILLVIGLMDLRAMAVVTAAITVERLAPAGERVARAIGALAVGGGLFLSARAAGLG